MYPQEPVVNPAVPFVDVIQGGLRPGYMVVVNGIVPGYGNGFQINFASGPTLDGPSRSPVAFHFNPRFNENFVARNSFNQQGWGPEENGGGLPLSRGKGFDILFLIEQHEYKVAINGQHFCAYAHRTPIEHVNTLQVVGDVQIEKIMLHAGQQPQQQQQPFGQQPQQPFGQHSFGQHPYSSGPQPMYNPAVPFEHPIPNFVSPGRSITIVGVPKSFPDRFNVDLFSAQQGGDVLLHFNPRYNPNRYVVRNSCIGGMWGEEQCDTPFFNFMPDARFNLRIICDHTQFIIYVNDQHFCYFKHRMPEHLTTHLRVDGDVMIDSVTFS